MAAKKPAMSPSDMPLTAVLDRAIGARRVDAETLLALHSEVLPVEPVVWAGRIVGFGEYSYRYDSGHGGIAPLLAFSPGPAKNTVYLAEHFSERWPDLIERLGPHSASKVCLYFSSLRGVDLAVLSELLRRSLDAR